MSEMDPAEQDAMQAPSMGDIVNVLHEQAEIELAEGNRTAAKLCKDAAHLIEDLRSKIADLEPDAVRLTAIIEAQADEIKRLRRP